jgi:hypothetical protein
MAEQDYFFVVECYALDEDLPGMGYSSTTFERALSLSLVIQVFCPRIRTMINYRKDCNLSVILKDSDIFKF